MSNESMDSGDPEVFDGHKVFDDPRVFSKIVVPDSLLAVAAGLDLDQVCLLVLLAAPAPR